MKKLAMTLVLLTGAALAVAGTAPAAVAMGDEKGAYGASDQTTMSGEVVSADTVGKTLTIKSDSGSDKTLNVDAKAMTSLKTVKAGDKVTVKIKNDAVTEIKTTAAPTQ